MLPVQPGPADWPLVGREPQLGRIEAAARTGGGVVLFGGPGVGKTRLALEAGERLITAGGRGEWVTATRSAAAVPLGVMAPLLAPGSGLAAPGSAPIAPNGGPASAHELDAMTRLLARFPAGGERQPLLVVDDAHLLDDATAALLFQLATSRRAVVLLTVRAGAPTPDAVQAIGAVYPAQRIEVPRLSDADVGRLLAYHLERPIDAVSARELQRRCAGSPLLLRELLLAGRETGRLRQAGGVWRWHGRQYVTHRLAEVVTSRLGPLPPELLELGELLACAGPLALPLLEDLAGPDAVTAAERCGLLTVEQSGRRWIARLGHPIYADVFRAGLPRTRERRLYRQLAEALAQTPMRRREDALLAAEWRGRAGLPCPPELLVSAARQALDRLDLDQAEQAARLAQQAGAGEPAQLVLAEVLTQRGRYAEAAQTMPVRLNGAEPELRTRWLVNRQRIDYFRTDHQPAGDVRLAGSAEPAEAPDPARPAEPLGLAEPTEAERSSDDPAARAAYSWLLVARGQNRLALRIAGAAPPAGHAQPAAASWAAAGVLAAAGLLGEQNRVLEVLSPALARADQHAETVPWGPVQVAAAGCLALLATGELVNARGLAERAYRRAVNTADRLGPDAAPMIGTCGVVLGMTARAAGYAPAAVAALTEAGALLADWPTFRLSRVYLAELAAAHALAGDQAAAGQRLSEVDAYPDPPPLFEAWVTRARAWVAAAGGDLPTACEQSLRAATLAGDTEQPTVAALAWFDVARFGEPGRACAQLVAVADRLPLPAVAALAQAAAALRGSEAAPLAAAASSLAGHGYLLYAAEAGAVAYARYAAAGRPAQAQRSLQRATTLARRCGRPRTPLLSSTRLHQLLTGRELQIASLAACGHSGGRIAAQLGLSPRTVNNHLGRVYQKLGITGRRQLATVLGESALPEPEPVG